MNIFLFLVCLGAVRTQEVATPSSQLKPRNYNYHAEQSRQYLDRLNKLLGPVPTRKGPVLFPPPPPDPPTQPTTTKPDAEPGNSFQQHYFARLTNYKPVTLATLAPDTLAPRISDDYVYDQEPYTDIEKKSIGSNYGRSFNEFETKTSLPTIYNPFAQNIQQTTQQSYPIYDYQSDIKINQNEDGFSEEGKNAENEKDKSYAFSYTVKDQKTGDDFSHSQQSSGASTNGEYRVKLPDGRLQIVSYTADENGYKADVRYDIDGVEYNYDNQNAHNRKDYNDYNQPINTNTDYKAPTIDKEPTKLDYSDISKEYYNDYSAEYKYEPHQSKFSILFDEKNNELKGFNQYLTSTAKPYLQLEDVLSKALPNVQPTFNYYPEETTENIVLIGNRNTFKDASDNFINNPTPRNYLVSTISSLRDRISSKPILSDSFINKINKYLTFN